MQDTRDIKCLISTNSTVAITQYYSIHVRYGQLTLHMFLPNQPILASNSTTVIIQYYYTSMLSIYSIDGIKQ